MKHCKADGNTKETRIAYIAHNSRTMKDDLIVREIPLTIVLNSTEIAILLCSPVKLEFLIAGYLLSEGFISQETKLERIDINEKSWHAQVEAKGGTISLDSSGRVRLVTPGCGNTLPFYRVVDAQKYESLVSNLKISAGKISGLMKEFQTRSVTFRQTGGVHACALCDENGIQCYAEDIGRHNALDKIIGEYFLRKLPMQETILLTTGRISSEILLKGLKAGIPIIVSRSSPTSLAVEFAAKSGITLIGFARGSKMNVYCGDSRIQTIGKTTGVSTHE